MDEAIDGKKCNKHSADWDVGFSVWDPPQDGIWDDPWWHRRRLFPWHDVSRRGGICFSRILTIFFYEAMQDLDILRTKGRGVSRFRVKVLMTQSGSRVRPLVRSVDGIHRTSLGITTSIYPPPSRPLALLHWCTSSSDLLVWLDLWNSNSFSRSNGGIY